MKKALVSLVLMAAFLAGCGGGEQAASDAADDSPGGSSANGGERAEADEEAPAGDGEGSVLRIDTGGGDPVEVRAEVVDSGPERQKGLMNRESLAEDAGMLFVFRSEQDLSFWMRNTLIPLSIAYIDSEGRIVDLQDMEALDDEPPHYPSAEPAQYALEVNQGFFAENGVEVGDTVELPES